MERERPEYLPPIKPHRWSFPWLTLIGLTVLVLAGFGIKQHLATQAAWNSRFAQKPPTTHQEVLTLTPAQLAELKANAEHEAKLAEERLQRIREQREAAEKDRQGWRCINGIPFRQIPGGWENVPGKRC